MPARQSRRSLNQRVRAASLADHDVRCLDNRKHIVAGSEGEIVDRLVGDRRGDDDAAADVDTDMRCRLTFGDRDDLAFELVAGAKLHLTLLRRPVNSDHSGGGLQRGADSLAAASGRSILSDTTAPAGKQAHRYRRGTVRSSTKRLRRSAPSSAANSTKSRSRGRSPACFYRGEAQ